MNWHFFIDIAEKRALDQCPGSMNKGDGCGTGILYGSAMHSGSGGGCGGAEYGDRQGGGRGRGYADIAGGGYSDGYGWGNGDGHSEVRRLSNK